MKILSKLTILSSFIGFFSLFPAQEQTEILDIKAKIKRSATPKEKIENLGKAADYYRVRGAVDSSLSYVQKLIPVLESQKDHKRLLRIKLLVAQSYMQKGDYPNAEQVLAGLKEKAENSDDVDIQALFNHLYGFYHVGKKEAGSAKKYFQKNIELYNRGKKIDKQFVMMAYQGLFSNSFAESNVKESFQNTMRYKDFVLKHFPEQRPMAYYLSGVQYMLAGDNKRAIDELKRSLQISDKKNVLLVSNIKNTLGINYVQSKKLDSARIYLNDAKAALETINYPLDLSRNYSGLAMLYKEEKNYKLAEEYIQKALKLVPEKNMENSTLNYRSILYSIQLSDVLQDSLNIKNDPAKRALLQDITNKHSNNFDSLKNTLGVGFVSAGTLQELSKANEYLGNYELALNYFKDSKKELDKVYGVDKMRELSDLQSERELNLQKAQIQLQEETKRINLQKEIELKALRFEYEKKQALAKTEEERKRLMLEEEMKRKEIELTYAQQQKQVQLKFEKEKAIAKANQEKRDAENKAEISRSKNIKNMWAIGTGLSVLLLGFAGFSYIQKQKDNKKIAREKQKSDKLLLNILPHEVAEELKEKGETVAKHYDQVSVLFTDFVNFTMNSEKMGVQEMMNELNVCFTAFDNIMEKNGLEKIKTIGDAYLAVSGIPVESKMHAQNAVKAGLEILKFIEKRKAENPQTFDIRIGIHSGPVIAGIVGVKKFAYDIWGDTVNTAARMEQKSESGKLNISEATYALVKNQFDFEYRGKIETKGKGEMDMYFVKN